MEERANVTHSVVVRVEPLRHHWLVSSQSLLHAVSSHKDRHGPLTRLQVRKGVARDAKSCVLDVLRESEEPELVSESSSTPQLGG